MFGTSVVAVGFLSSSWIVVVVVDDNGIEGNSSSETIVGRVRIPDPKIQRSFQLIPTKRSTPPSSSTTQRHRRHSFSLPVGQVPEVLYREKSCAIPHILESRITEKLLPVLSLE